jgi:hypothetical protein
MPRVAVPATLLLAGGGTRIGEVYVQDRVSQHAGPETPLDMLNRPDAFFPFRPKDDGTSVLLVAKARTVTLTVAQPKVEDTVRLSAAKKARFEVTLADGSTLSGWATLELPEHHSRLLDYLNAVAQPFFALMMPSELLLVNRAHVLYARPED